MQKEINLFAAPSEVVGFAERHGFAYFGAGPTDMRLIAYEAARLGSPLRFDAVITRSAIVTEHTEQVLKDLLGARTLPVYASKEGYRMACRCASTSNYHVNSEIVLLEVLDGDGQPCAPGQTGRVVITPLFSAAQPLIRYDTGDLAIVGAPCSCGRNLPVLTQIVGRSKHLFKLPDGRVVLPMLTTEPLLRLNAKAFQVAQLSEREIEVRYVPQEPDGSDEGAVAELLMRQTLHQMNISFRRLEEFPRDPTKKHMEYVSELPEGPL